MTWEEFFSSMTFILFAAGIAFLIFAGAILLINIGRNLGRSYLQQLGTTEMPGLNAIESAIFALLGLLLAFAISGALHRFDERRTLVLQETNAISTAYNRIDLFDAVSRDRVRGKLRAYVEARLEFYEKPLDFSFWEHRAVYDVNVQHKIAALRKELWQEAVAACPPGTSNTACVLVIPAINHVLEAAVLRSGANERHPPQAIYIMLFGLALGGALLAGFSMAAAKSRSSVHMIIFSGALAVTLYVVTDIEFPRLGLIRVDSFDHFMLETLEDMR